MKITLEVENNKADVFIRFIKRLDFISILKLDSKDQIKPIQRLSEKEKAAVEIGIKEAEAGELIPHEEVVKEMREKYPNIFKDV